MGVERYDNKEAEGKMYRVKKMFYILHMMGVTSPIKIHLWLDRPFPMQWLKGSWETGERSNSYHVPLAPSTY